MSRPTYKKLSEQIRSINKELYAINEQISLADNEYELMALVAKLNSYENELLVAEEYMERVLSRGRE
jgi:hypothetical protein